MFFKDENLPKTDTSDSSPFRIKPLPKFTTPTPDQQAYMDAGELVRIRELVLRLFTTFYFVYVVVVNCLRKYQDRNVLYNFDKRMTKSKGRFVERYDKERHAKFVIEEINFASENLRSTGENFDFDYDHLEISNRAVP